MPNKTHGRQNGREGMKADCYDVTDVCNTFCSCLHLCALQKGVHSNKAGEYAYSFVFMHSNEVVTLFIDNLYQAIVRRALKALQEFKGGDTVT